MWRSAGNHVDALNYWENTGAARKYVTSQKSVPSTSASSKSVKGSVQGDYYAKWYYGGAKKLPADQVMEGMEGLIFKPHQSGRSKGELAKEQAEKRTRVEAWRKKAGKHRKNYEYYLLNNTIND